MATNAHTEEHSGPKGAFPPFQKDTFASQLVWFAITFVALYLLASRLMLPRIGSIFEARRAKVAEDLGTAERLRGESEAALAAYEKSLAEARSRAQALENEARNLANKDAEKTRKVLEEQLNQKLAEAEKSIAATRNAAMANVRGIATEAAR